MKSILRWNLLILLLAARVQAADVFVPVGQLRAAHNAAQPNSGVTLKLAAGQHPLTTVLALKSGVTIDGQGVAEIKWGGGKDYALLGIGISNAGINNCIITGTGVKFERCSNISFTGNTVQNVTSGDAYFGNGITAMDNTGLNVLRNKFLNIGHRGLMVFSVTESKFEDNLFESCYQAIHFNNFSPSRNVSFSYNTIRGCKRHGIEMQSYGDTDNWLVESNLVELWADGRPGWPSHMAISFAMGNTVDVAGGGKKPIRSNGHILRGNVVIADGAIPTMISQGVPAMYFTAFEVMGNGTIVENNYGEGWGWWQLIGRADKNWITRNNTWLGTAAMPVIPGVGAQIGREIVPNDWQGGPAVNSGNYYGKIGDRQRPVAGVRPLPDPNPTPVPDPGPSAPSNITVSNITDTSATISWKDNSANETAFEVLLMPGNPADAVKILCPANSTNATFTQGKPRWVWKVTVTAKTPAGNLSSAAVPFQNAAVAPIPIPTLQGFSGSLRYSDSTTKPVESNPAKVLKSVRLDYTDGTNETKP